MRADGRKGGPFPLTASDTLPAGVSTEDALDLYDEQVVVADLDGDGADGQPVLMRSGSVEVLGAERALARTQGVVARGKAAGYFPRAVHRARVRGKDVVFVLYERRLLQRANDAELARGGFAERHQLVRIDEKGATRLRLAVDGFRPKEVVAVGALNRPGSSEVDELVLVSRMPGAKEPVLSRHGPDGALLAPPRALYVPFPASRMCAFEFLPQSGRAVAFDPGSARLYFIAPEKPVNWIRAVDLSQVASGKGGAQLLAVADAGSAPKAIVRKGAAVFAVDEEGAFYTAPGGAWMRSQAPEPLFQLTAPSPRHHLVGVFPSVDGSEPFLVVHTRPAEAVEVPVDDLIAAADRFLATETLDQDRAMTQPSMRRRDRVRDDLIAEERARKGGIRPRRSTTGARASPNPSRSGTSALARRSGSPSRSRS